MKHQSPNLPIVVFSLLAAVLLHAVTASACSAVIVGKKASATGYVLVAHNNDGALTLHMRYAMVPARDGTQAYFWCECKNPKGGITPGDTMLNASGVIVASNNGGWNKSWCGRQGSLPDEGWFSELAGGSGIGYELRRTVAERAHTAREGLAIATNLLTVSGYCQPSRNFVIADRDEAWVLEVVKGRRFVSRRCPDDAVVAYPNCMTISRIEPGDVVSGNIEARRRDFDFSAAYQGPRTWKSPYNFFRLKHLYRLVCGAEPPMDGPCPFSMKPLRPVTPQMVRDALCSHYEGTPDAVTPHPDKELEVAESSRAPICRSSTLESFVCTFTAKPEDTEFAIAVGRPCETPYASYRPLSGTLPTNAVTGDAALRRMAGRDLPLSPPSRAGGVSGNGPL